MPHRGRLTVAGRRLTRVAAAGLLLTLVAACGGGGSNTGSSGPTSPGGGGTDVGEPYDEALVEGAAAALAGLDSFVYEASIAQTGGDGSRTQSVHGIVRTSPEEARSVSYTAGGDTIVLVYVEGKDWADYGAGFIEVTAANGTREDTDPLAIHVLYGAFSGVAGDMVVAGRETTHGIPTVHLVLNEDELADQRERLGEGAEGWIAELWLAEADGMLVKAVWGGPQAPPPSAFGQAWFTIDVTDVDCECPVTPPS